MKRSIAAASGSNRIEVADVLRGVAVAGITLIHFVERFSLYSYPEVSCGFLKFTDHIVWDGVYFAVSGKAYAIFALLFGFSFFIQDNSQREKGRDFRGRFAWRLVLLGVFAAINSTLFPGEILVLYALLGWVLIAVCRLSTRTVAAIVAVMLLQPVEWVQLGRALLDPSLTVNATFDAPYWEAVNVAQREGGFLEMCRTAIWTGNVANMGWMVLYGRVTQTAGLFMAGMLIGRAGLFHGTERNTSQWMKVFMASVAAFFPLWGMVGVLPDFVEREALLVPLTLIFKQLSNLAFTGMVFAGVIVLYYRTRLRGALGRITSYGRMSMSNYLSQSLLGAFLFYNWGLGLYRHTGITVSLLIGVAVLLVQWRLCALWLRSHRQGPLEWLWKRATWIKTTKTINV
jgi:uncharacterized protein